MSGQTTRAERSAPTLLTHRPTPYDRPLRAVGHGLICNGVLTCCALPTAMIITGTSALRLKKRARVRCARVVPWTPRETEASEKPLRYSASQIAW